MLVVRRAHALRTTNQEDAGMRSWKILMTLGSLAIAASALAGLFVWRDGGRDAPLATTATVADPAVTEQVIAFFQDRIERDPADVTSHTKLGEAYVRQARETGDIGAYERAEAALRRALELDPADGVAGAALATVLFAKHDFAGALATAERVYAADPGATQALATAGDARLELGDYEGARTAYAMLSDVAGGPAVLSRQAHLAELTGDPDEALELLTDAANEAARRGRSAESIAWYRSQVGALYVNTGKHDAAEPWFAAALDVFPGYYPALAGLGSVAAARGDDAGAIAYYEQAVAVVPQPSLLATLGDLYARTGDAGAAQRQYDTVGLIGRLAEINRIVYNRELALFYADHDINTAQAVELALAELEVRKDVYGYDVAAWALYKDGRAMDALPLVERALRLGTRDARLLFHAGMIAGAAGDEERARALLEDALDINPRFSVLQEAEARQALAALESGRPFVEAREGNDR